MGKAQESPHRDIIVLGASAGGVQALCEVMGSLPPNLPAAIFVVLHIAARGRSAMPAILSRAGCLPASHPKDGEPILPGRIYIAPPDHHLVMDDSTVCLSRNAAENGHRPAVDVLFRSAAREYGRRVIAVVMTGNLDDGTAGLALVKRLGGVAVVQDPEDADYPSMPESAITHVEVDYVVPLANIGSLLDRLVHEPLPEQDEEPTPEEREEVPDMSEQEEQDGSVAGEPAGLVCPDCGGSLFEKPGVEPLHFRCRTGHAYSPESLIAKQTDALEAALWAAMRALQENAALARRMERRAQQSGGNGGNGGNDGNGVSERYHKRAEDAEKHAAFLRTLLQHGGADLEG